MKSIFTLASLFLLCLMQASALTMNHIPEGSIYYPSICADGHLIAYLSSLTTGGGSTVKLYNTSTGSTVTCSTSIPFCSRPRISRDGNFVTFFGTPFYGVGSSSDWYKVCPIVYTVSSGTWVSAIDLVNTTIPEANTTTIWSTTNPQYAWQAPGITNSNNGSWKVSFGDLTGRNATEDGTPEWVCTSSAANSDPTHVYYTPNEGVGLVQTDLDATGSTLVYRYSSQIYVNGTQKTTANSTCEWPSIDAAGDLVAYDTAKTGGQLSGENVYILNVSTGSSTCPYTASVTTGYASHPFISSDGYQVAFNTTSKALDWSSSYTFPTTSGTIFAAVCPTTYTTNSVFILSFNTTTPTNAEPGLNPCVANATNSGAFESDTTYIMSGTPSGQGIFYYN